MQNNIETYQEIPELQIVDRDLVDYENLIKNNDLEFVSDKLLDGALGQIDFMKKDILDRFIDFIFFKVQTGYVEILSLAYPTKRMVDRELEKPVIGLLNKHLFPEIVLKLLKFFSRNVHDPDTNLYIANLINSDEIILSIYETYKLFRKDIFISDPEKRSLNVKRIQQFSARSENNLSSPLDMAAIFKYILEFFLVKYKYLSVYTHDDIRLAP